MKTYSTREAARVLGITQVTLSTYIKVGKVPPPKTVQIGRLKVHSWSEGDIARLRKLLPKIANGRKTRWQRQREKQKPPARALVPHKQGSRKQKRSKKKK